MEVMQIINIVAIILSPIVAVVVGERLNNHTSRRKDKMHVFETLHKNVTPFLRLFTGEGRDKIAEEAVLKAIEITPIVFSKEKRVLDIQLEMKNVHEDLMERVKNGKDLPKDVEKYLETLRKFMITIAKDLGYKKYSPFMYGRNNSPSPKKV